MPSHNACPTINSGNLQSVGQVVMAITSNTVVQPVAEVAVMLTSVPKIAVIVFPTNVPPTTLISVAIVVTSLNISKV